MAGIADAFTNAMYSPQETGWGMAASGAIGALPGLYNPYASTSKNFWVTAGGGIVAALLTGMARNQADKENAAMYGQYLQSRDGDATTRQAAVNAYPRLATIFATRDAMRDERSLDIDQKIQELKLSNEMDIDKYKRLTPLEVDRKRQEEIAKREVSPDLLDKLPADSVKSLALSSSIINEARNVATELDKADQSWAELKTSKLFSGMDDKGIALQMQNLADKLGRARSGAAMSEAEQSLYNKLIGGDITASPKQSAQLLRKLANAEARTSKSVIDFGITLSNNPKELSNLFVEQDTSSSVAPTRQFDRGAAEREAAALAASGKSESEVAEILRAKYR
jgi:hypothetical protein